MQAEKLKIVAIRGLMRTAIRNARRAPIDTLPRAGAPGWR
jgi:hypothetical protein